MATGGKHQRHYAVWVYEPSLHDWALEGKGYSKQVAKEHAGRYRRRYPGTRISIRSSAEGKPSAPPARENDAALENPRRPPKQWMRHCIAGASRSAKNPGAVCGALWYHKMSASERRAALRREGKDEGAMLENADPAGALLAIAIGAVVVFGIAWALKRENAPSAPACASFADLTAFEQSKGYHLWYVENQSVSTWTAAKAEFTSDPMARAFSQFDCGFYRYANGAWTSDAATNAELAAFRGTVKTVSAPRIPVLTQHPIRALLPVRGST